jgi:thioredoxin 1
LTARVILFFSFLFFVVWGLAGHGVFAASVTPTPDGLSFVSGNQFQTQVDFTKIPVVLDFWASWCVPCQVYSPVIEDASRTFKGKMAFYKVDVSDSANEQRVKSYSIESIPTILVIENGEVVERWEGMFKPHDLKSKLKQVLKNWLKTSSLNP